MQRKLIRSMTALSATVAVFALLMLAAGPATAPTLPPVAPAVVVVAADADASEATIEAADPVSAATRQRHHLRRARIQLALPYFSFAQGLRHGRS